MNSKILLILGGGALLYWWYSRNNLPADAVYMGSVPAGSLCNGVAAATVMYLYHSASTGQSYCVSTPPHAPAATGTPAPAPAPAPAPVSSVPVAPAPPPAPPPAPVQTAAPYAQTLANIKNAINSSGVSTTFIFGLQSPDTWNWYAMQAIPGWTAPAPESIYPGVPNAHQPVSFNDWWGRVQQFLPAGLSGFVPRSPLFNRLYGGWMA